MFRNIMIYIPVCGRETNFFFFLNNVSSYLFSIHKDFLLILLQAAWSFHISGEDWNLPSCAWLPFSLSWRTFLSSWSCWTWTWSSSHLLLHCCSFSCSSCSQEHKNLKPDPRTGMLMYDVPLSASWARKYSTKWVFSQRACLLIE